ncbi:hypothetical protein Tco_0444896 [Tanacetum coccineum]
MSTFAQSLLGITEQVKSQTASVSAQEVSNFAPSVIKPHSYVSLANAGFSKESYNQDQEENLGNEDEDPKGKVASKRDWFTKPKRTQEPIDLDWNEGKTPHQGTTQSWLMTLASSADKPSKTFDELMSTPIDFSANS